MSPTDARLAILQNGFVPTPCAGKEPVATEWQKKINPTADEVRRWGKYHAGARNTGILCQRAPTIDIDITVEPAARATEDLAREQFGGGHFLVRIGLPPKRAILLRTDEPFKKVSASFLASDGSKQKIEVLGDGQQVIVDGIHPGSGKPYDWYGGSPLSVRRDDLPLVSEKDVLAFLEKATALLIREHGFTQVMPAENGRRDRHPGAETFFSHVNSVALTNLAAWVPAIFGADAEPAGTGGYRVSSASLGRELQEALSLHPSGIVDFGVHDMGDEREGKRTPIDIVIEYGADAVNGNDNEVDAMTAAQWLCEQLDVDPGELERPNAADEFSDAFSEAIISLPDHWVRKLFGLPDATPSPPTQPGAKADGKGAVWQWRFFGRQEDIVVRSYLVDKLLPETGVGLISGQWGTYKTFVAVDLAAAVITGNAFAGFDVVRQGGVLFIAMEGQEEVDIRTRAALTQHGFTDVLAPFAWIDTAPRFLERGAGQKLAAMVAEGAQRMQREFGVPVALVIVDTAGKAAGYEKAGDENDSVLGRQIVAAMAEASRKTGALFIGVDHFGKSAETGTRGSSAKEADCDVVLALLGEKGVGGKVTNPRLAIRKRRSGPNGVEIPFKPHIVAVGDEGETTLVVNWVQADQVAPSPKPDKWSKSLTQLQQAIMTVLADYAVELQPVAGGPDVQAVDYELVREEFYAIYPADGTEQQRASAKRKAFNRAVTDAQGKDLIGVREIGATTFMWFA